MYYYVVIPTYSKEFGYRKNVFGPYNTWEQAQELVDKMEMPSIVVELPTRDREEATKILEKMKWED